MSEEIALKLIDSNPFQQRQKFSEEKLKELADSIKRQGLLQTIEVRPHNERYQVIYGERRLRAFKLLGRSTIPTMVREATDHEMCLRALMENVHREDLESAEREEAVHKLWTFETGDGKRYYKTQQELANDLSVSNQ